MRIFFYACAMAALCVPVYGQQLLCDYTAEADAADIDGLELLMGDPLNSCEGYSVSFTDFLNAIEVTGITSTAIDVDGDGVDEVSIASSRVNFDPDDDGVVESFFDSDGSVNLPHTVRAVEFGDGSSYFRQTDDANDAIRHVTGAANGQFLWYAGDQDGTEGSYDLRVTATAVDITSDFSASGDLTSGDDVFVGDDLNLTSAGGLARLGAMSGALPTCDAATARAVVFDQTGDLCACPPDGSDWYDVSDGLGTTGDCA